jgi:hypothetical protein
VAKHLDAVNDSRGERAPRPHEAARERAKVHVVDEAVSYQVPRALNLVPLEHVSKDRDEGRRLQQMESTVTRVLIQQ